MGRRASKRTTISKATFRPSMSTKGKKVMNCSLQKQHITRQDIITSGQILP